MCGLCTSIARNILSLVRVYLPTQEEFEEALQRYTVGEDCPVFAGLYEYCTKYAGGSVGGAVKLNWGQSDIAINWAGGLHHGKKSEVRYSPLIEISIP